MFRVLLAIASLVPSAPRAAAADIEPTFRHEPLKKLLVELKDKNVMIRRQAATTLGLPDGSEGKGGPRPRGDLWPAMLALVEAQADSDMQVRANAMKSLGLLMRFRGVVEKNDERFEKIALAAIAALKDSEGLVRSAAAASLWQIGIETEKGRTELLAAMKHDDAKVRAAAAEGARGVRPIGKIAAELGERISDRDEAVRLAAVNSLIQARSEAAPAVKALIAALRDPGERLSAAAATALGNVGPGAAEAIPPLVDLLADGKVTARTAAALAISAIQAQPEIGVPALIGALANTETRIYAIHALRQYGPRAGSAIPALFSHSRDVDGSVFPATLDAIHSIDPGSVAYEELILAALFDPKPSVRTFAIGFTDRGVGEADPTLLPMLMFLFQVDANARPQLARAIGELGVEGRPAIPMMMELIGNLNTNASLRRVLINAVNRIDPALLRPSGK